MAPTREPEPPNLDAFFHTTCIRFVETVGAIEKPDGRDLTVCVPTSCWPRDPRAHETSRLACILESGPSQ